MLKKNPIYSGHLEMKCSAAALLRVVPSTPAISCEKPYSLEISAALQRAVFSCHQAMQGRAAASRGAQSGSQKPLLNG